MISKKILEIFNKNNKKIYTLQELATYSGAKRATLKVTLSRMVSQKKIYRIGSGLYAKSQIEVDVESLACQMVVPSYISLEYALFLHGIYGQVPASLTLITTQKTKALSLSNTNIEYSHLKKELFKGYEIRKNALIALPEKALLDELYFIGLGKRRINLQELDISKINKSKTKKWLALYPPSTKKLWIKLSAL